MSTSELAIVSWEQRCGITCSRQRVRISPFSAASVWADRSLPPTPSGSTEIVRLLLSRVRSGEGMFRLTPSRREVVVAAPNLSMLPGS